MFKPGSGQTGTYGRSSYKRESVWLIIVYCFFTEGSVRFLQLSFVIFVGEEVTVFEFAREECEKKFENHCST